MKYSRGDGSFWSLVLERSQHSKSRQFSNLYCSQSRQSDSHAAPRPNELDPFLQSGERRVFDRASGNLLAITDRNGNTTELTYDSHFRLVTVTDPASRHLYFAYASPASYLVTASLRCRSFLLIPTMPRPTISSNRARPNNRLLSV